MVVYYFLNDTRKRELHTWTLNYLTGEVLLMIDGPDMLKDRMIAQISTRGHFLYCTLNKKANSIAVYDFRSDSAAAVIRYSSPTLWDELTHTDGLLRDLDFVTVQSPGQPSVDFASCFKKFYVSGDYLFLLSNLQNGVTHIYSFNLVSKTASHRVLQHELAKTEINPFNFKNNSFLLADKLYYIWVNSEKMGMEITDFESGKVLKKYGVSKNEDIEFKNTPIIQEGGGPVYLNVTRELDATSKLLRKMHRGRPVIIASPSDSNRVAILIGAYMETSTPGPGFGVSMFSSAAFSFSAGLFLRLTEKKSARFKMLVNEANEYVQGDMPHTLNEQIEAYTDDQQITVNAENLFTSNGNTYYCYYHKKEGRLVIMKW